MINLDLAQKVANCIRLLSVEAIEKAKSGHPGLPLGAVDFMYVLWQKYLKFNPEKPHWINRDRFVLSAGHGSMLLYSLLHLYGYDISLDDLKNFRQLNSKTPGHPEYGLTPGVESSTGALGQGIANAVGMAIAYEMLKQKLSKDGWSPINHKIYVLASDGDIMEGISSECCSLAGHLQLTNLVVIYDDNNITIDGNTNITFSENVEQRFKSYGWDVYKVDGHNYVEIDHVLAKVSKTCDKPTLIISKTQIAKGSKKFVGSNKAHGAPLGEAEICEMKKGMNIPQQECFYVCDDVKLHIKKRVNELKNEYDHWVKEFEQYLNNNPDIKKIYDEYNSEQKVDPAELLNIPLDKNILATRVASGMVLQYLSKKVTNLVGGSADLANSTNTNLTGYTSFSKTDRSGRNIHFGIREHSMAAILNGIALYGNFVPFGSTFLIFSDYMKPAIRMSALMKLHIVYVFSHDSILVGEDGPTHQPIEHLWSLRLIPGIDVLRPADAMETFVAWAQAINNNKNPTALILSRQNLPVIDRKKYASAEGLLKGGYIISEAQDKNNLKLIIIATGSEVSLALEVQKRLEQEKVSVRVVSMPSVEIFEQQNESYKEQVLPPLIKNKVVIELGSTAGWYKYVGLDGLVIGIDEFGVSAPAEKLAEKYGFTVEKVYQKIKSKFKL